ncbi:hypothetical protein HER32_10795 [Hymenobacter sp. BT18]|uniref:hypothetical protein n=1 Tax=Hymenobacter sp. BT18 TaxID=2835648 RepID=UPI00143EB42E|nr:hypothetical protein [Hymenobacter sp. BT18]QIX61638.1 hypothetical protein HER32_10795 [Hymenobacter sp. BT18]
MKLLTLRAARFSAFAAALLLTASCAKDSDQAAPLESTVSAEDHGAAEESSADLLDLVNAAAPETAANATGTEAEADDLARVAGGCLTRTYDPATRTLTLDFGPVNCAGPNGRLRRGKIVAVFSPQLRQAGGTITVTLVDYYVNDRQHTGTRLYTNLGQGSYSLEVQGASIITPEGTAQWTSQRTYTRTAGFGTRALRDDAYSVTGTATGTNRKGVSYTATIEQPLMKSFAEGCARHFVAGTVRITNSKGKELLLNYDPAGTATCDNQASVTVNGQTRVITLP